MMTSEKTIRKKLFRLTLLIRQKDGNTCKKTCAAYSNGNADGMRRPHLKIQRGSGNERNRLITKRTS